LIYRRDSFASQRKHEANERLRGYLGASLGFLVATAVILPTDTVAAPDVAFVDRVLPPLRSVRPAPVAPFARITFANLNSSTFALFARQTMATTFTDVIKSRPDVQQRAFENAQRYIDNLYGGVTSPVSISIGNITFDCVPTRQQPSLRNGDPIDQPPNVTLMTRTGRSILGYTDKTCPTGTIPLKRTSVGTITQYATLQDYFAKDRGLSTRDGMAAPQVLNPMLASGTPAPDGHIHRYALVREDAVATGIHANLNIWSPTISSDEMSLSQTWIAGGGTQTLESGWQVGDEVDPSRAAPFIYSTQDGYAFTGCYDLDCAGFVQTTSEPVFAPFAPSFYSSPTGAQQVMDIEWHRNPVNGNWWLALNGTWAGYYPARLFSSGPLGLNSPNVEILFGGENTGSTAQAQMGSGQFADQGFSKAAYQSRLSYWDQNGQVHDVAGDEYVTNGKCYSLARSLISAPPNDAGSYFYFGGPGLLDPICAQSEAP